MRTKVKEIKKEEVQHPEVKGECHHFWLIDSAKGPTSRGRCKVCGATREFYNAIPEPEAVVKKHVPFQDMPELAVASGEPPNES
ncbi:MAG: hypothetical protein Q7R57_01715 [Dehalococcoidales bacterium]|nr:hypothetical protein [Dehalococcoidales bacterium]